MDADLPSPSKGLTKSGNSRVAIIGAGWAGLAAAIRATQCGHHVTVLEMAGLPGGRARTIESPVHGTHDNGQHILIGAYTETLKLMQTVGINPSSVLERRPLALVNAQGQGLRLPPGSPQWAFLKAVWKHPQWSWKECAALTAAAMRWRASGFRCPPAWSVTTLSTGIPERIRQDFIDPLCVAALNTPAAQASAQVFLRVLKDALCSGPGSTDLLLPKVRLGNLLPLPAQAWLEAHGADFRFHQRVQGLEQVSGQWRVTSGSASDRFDKVVLACSATEAARLVEPINPAWAHCTRALHHEPIVTVTLMSPGTRLPEPMLNLTSDSHTQPAQFVFDQGQLAGTLGELSMVISGAQPWVKRGLEQTTRASIRQAEQALTPWLKSPITVVHTIAEKRATFICSPGLQRPTAKIAPQLWAAADYVSGPYPATLEGAVRCATMVVQSWLETDPSNPTVL